MAQELASLHTGVIYSLSKLPSSSEIQALSLAFGKKNVLDAFDLIDHGEVSKITMPNGRFLFTVSGSTASYTVYPDVLAEGYCPCPSFSQAVINTGTNIICKHLLAVKIALQIDGCIEKSQGLTWIAGLATNFAAAPQT